MEVCEISLRGLAVSCLVASHKGAGHSADGGCHAQALTAWRRVNLVLPTVEVRFENLHIETEVYAETSRQLPSLWNAVRSSVEVSGYVDCQSTSALLVWLHSSSCGHSGMWCVTQQCCLLAISLYHTGFCVSTPDVKTCYHPRPSAQPGLLLRCLTKWHACSGHF